MSIILPLTDDAVQSYAGFYGWTTENEQTADEFVINKLVEKITNDLIESRNRQAVEAVQDQPVIVTEE
jgi:hypothetical protein